MNLGKITVITPPDKIFNSTLSYLLVKPSITVQQQLQSILSKSFEDINVFIFNDNELDIDWLLSVFYQVDLVVIDIDNCDPITKQFITFMIARPNVYYITSDETTPYNLISKNRIYDLAQIVEEMDNFEDEDDDESEEE